MKSTVASITGWDFILDALSVANICVFHITSAAMCNQINKRLKVPDFCWLPNQAKIRLKPDSVSLPLSQRSSLLYSHSMVSA